MVGVPKGTINNPNGRPVGAINKATRGAREAIAMFVEGNVERLEGWLDQIAEENPLAAFDRFMSVVEYHIPKLQRQEITGKDGERLQINVVSGVNLQAVDADYVEVNPIAIESKPVDEKPIDE